AAYRLRPGQPESVRHRRHQAGACRATAERARERGQAGADVLRLVVVAGWGSRGEALGRFHAEIVLPATRRGVRQYAAPSQDHNEQPRAGPLGTPPTSRTAPDAGAGAAGAAGDPAAGRAAGRLARLAVGLPQRL